MTAAPLGKASNSGPARIRVQDKLPKVAAHLDTARADVLAFTSFPKELWRQIWSNNPNG